MVAAFRRADFFLAAGTSLVVETFHQLLERVALCDPFASMASWASSIVNSHLASSASIALTFRAKRQTHTSFSEELATDDSADFVPMLAIQAHLHRRGILFLLHWPQVPEVIIK